MNVKQVEPRGLGKGKDNKLAQHVNPDTQARGKWPQSPPWDIPTTDATGLPPLIVPTSCHSLTSTCVVGLPFAESTLFIYSTRINKFKPHCAGLLYHIRV